MKLFVVTILFLLRLPLSVSTPHFIIHRSFMKSAWGRSID